MASPDENSERGVSGLGIQCTEGNASCDDDPHHNPVPVCQQDQYEIISLIEGYSINNGPGAQIATGSSTLVKGRKNVVVDTGNPSDKERLLCALEEAGVRPDEVDYVIGTHGHSDHVGNLNLFQEATFIVSYDVSKKDHYTVHKFMGGPDGVPVPYKIDDGLEVIATPGHSHDDVTVIVRNTNLGVVAITGDLFEKEEDLRSDNIWTQYTENEQLQRESREKILQQADYIVPGHGPMFKNPRRN